MEDVKTYCNWATVRMQLNAPHIKPDLMQVRRQLLLRDTHFPASVNIRITCDRRLESAVFSGDSNLASSGHSGTTSRFHGPDLQSPGTLRCCQSDTTVMIAR